MKNLKIGIATPPIKVGNLKYNADEIIKTLDKSKADIVLFPELNLTSLYCGDLFISNEFLENVLEEAKRIISNTIFNGLFTIGMPLNIDGYLLNALLVINKHKVIGVEYKTNLTLDELRYFDDMVYFDDAVVFGKKVKLFQSVYEVNDLRMGIVLNPLQDIFEISSNIFDRALDCNVVLNASGDYEVLNSGVFKLSSVLEASKGLVYVYASPSKTESTSKYVYAGDMIVALDGKLVKEATNLYDDINYIEEYIAVDKLLELRKKEKLEPSENLTSEKNNNESKILSPHPFLEENEPFEAASVINTLLVQALIKKVSSLPEHLRKIIIGVSGGADSTLALLVAEQALEKMGLPSTNLIGVSMPSENSLEISSKRALELIEGVKATKLLIPIDKQLKVHLEAINHQEKDTTYENAQARIRTNILMDLANKYGGIVVGPSDLSEIALGFTTYNGDASSMYGINSGVPKTLVLTTLEYLSSEVYIDLSKVIFDISKTKPSPELLKNQTAENMLGRYDINDFILYHFIKNNWGKVEFLKYIPKVFKITKEEAETYVDRFFKRFFKNQFKRNVLPEGPNVLDFSLNPKDGFRLTGDNEIDY